MSKKEELSRNQIANLEAILPSPPERRVATHDRPTEDFSHPENMLRIMPVRQTVLFPNNVIPLTTGKEWSLESVERAMRTGGSLGIVTQRDSNKSATLQPEDLYNVGTEAKILKVIKFPEGTIGAVVQGFRRFRIKQFLGKENEIPEQLIAEVEFFDEESISKMHNTKELAALERGLRQLVHKAVQLSPNLPSEVNLFIENVKEPGYLTDMVIPYLSLDVATKQGLLETTELPLRLKHVYFHLTKEVEILEMTQKLQSDVKSELGKQQRRYFLKEQLRQLQKELGELEGRPGGATSQDPTDLALKVSSSAMPPDVKEAAHREIERLGMMQPGSPEYMVSHGYVNWLIDMPWGVYSQESIKLDKTQKILNEDHYGLEKVKQRILEFLAVYSLKSQMKSPILLLVGPPGVGKTSLGRSIARALNRKFVRIALGGVRDEAEIRGHRRTYIGSMPGKFVDALKKAGTQDPVILLDEVDKMVTDFRGDPSSALLEVLDSEQNNAFVDHYLNVPVDLSKVLFICTANALDTIPAPLRDRMEVIELSGYTLQEKKNIAIQHLVPQVLDEHGLKDRLKVDYEEKVFEQVIIEYTREAGVRELRRQLAGIARKLAMEVVASKQPKNSKKLPKRLVKTEELSQFLGIPKFPMDQKPAQLPIGVATGLAYTPFGGDVLLIETQAMAEGSGKLTITGQLGDVMKESVQTALGFLSGHPDLCQVEGRSLKSHDLHIHFPAGAVRKDGPSAGVAILLAMTSRFAKKPLKSDLAVTGEISLRGKVLPVGGIKEKLLAAHRWGIKTVLIPKENEKDLMEIPSQVRRQLKIHLIEECEEALALAFPPSKGKSTKRKSG